MKFKKGCEKELYHIVPSKPIAKVGYAYLATVLLSAIVLLFICYLITGLRWLVFIAVPLIVLYFWLELHYSWYKEGSVYLNSADVLIYDEVGIITTLAGAVERYKIYDVTKIKRGRNLKLYGNIQAENTVGKKHKTVLVIPFNRKADTNELCEYLRERFQI